MELVEAINRNLKETIGTNDLLLPLFLDKPINIGDAKCVELGRGDALKEFLTIVSKIAREAIFEQNTDITDILFSEAPLGLSIDYHKNLPECCWRIPILFRTDESVSGKVYEIQSPGSGWGDLHLYATSYRELGIDVPEEILSFPDKYAQNLILATGKECPKVFHMTDASSVPYSIRYLLGVTNKLKYWGYSADVNMRNIDCLISHSVISIPSSNYFSDYLRMAADGDMVFAVPPNLIFDEKAIYLLPFYRKTRHYFSDRIRELFPFTTVLENGGFYDENGKFVRADEFSKLSPNERGYYLKYGGPDTNRNWGSRSVFRLSGNDCNEKLESALEKVKEGEVWLLQKDESKIHDSNKISDDLKDLMFKKKLHVKLSCFYGQDDEPMGIKIMARRHFKVHGQTDTFVGLGVKEQ